MLAIVPVLCLWSLTAFAQTERTDRDWEGIVPLVSSRSQVEVIFGKAKKTIGEITIYETKEYSLTVAYAGNLFDKEKIRARFDVSDDTVYSISVRFVAPLPLASLGFKREEFEIRPNDDGLWMYSLTKSNMMTRLMVNETDDREYYVVSLALIPVKLKSK